MPTMHRSQNSSISLSWGTTALCSHIQYVLSWTALATYHRKGPLILPCMTWLSQDLTSMLPPTMWEKTCCSVTTPCQIMKAVQLLLGRKGRERQRSRTCWTSSSRDLSLWIPRRASLTSRTLTLWQRALSGQTRYSLSAFTIPRGSSWATLKTRSSVV